MGARQADADSLAEIASKALFFHIASGSEVNHAESPTTNISYRGTYCSLRFFNSGTRARSTLALRTTVEVIGRSLTDRGAELIRLVDIKVPPSKPSSEVKQGLPWDVEADGWFAHPAVTIGLTIGTSSPTLSPSSPDPFYITVTARILTSPQPSRPITLQTHPSPLEDLSNRSFDNIACIDTTKYIEIYPRGWPQYHWDEEDLRSSWSFVTIPACGEGSYVARHELQRDKILATDLQKGERYRVNLTDKCLGTRWWAFKDLNELEGVRLRTWRGPIREKQDRDDPRSAEEREREIQERFGGGPSCMGEEPEMLAMVMESGAEFEIV